MTFNLYNTYLDRSGTQWTIDTITCSAISGRNKAGDIHVWDLAGRNGPIDRDTDLVSCADLGTQIIYGDAKIHITHVAQVNITL